MKTGTKNILGLDLGTNSIGWALVNIDHDRQLVTIKCMGSRIIPMDPAEISVFENGGHMQSAAAERREARTPRKMRERFLLRRDRLNYVLNIYSMLPEHYRLEIDMDTPSGLRCGKFKIDCEPKIAYSLNHKENNAKHAKYDFLFADSYREMRDDLLKKNNGNIPSLIPQDWTLYYLRKKALTEEVSLQELSWILHSFNKKRGYEKVAGSEDENANLTSDDEVRICRVTQVEKTTENSYKISLHSKEQNSSWNFSYNEESNLQQSFVNDIKQVYVHNKYSEEGDLDLNKTTYEINEIVLLTINDIEVYGKKHVFKFTNGWEWESSSKRVISLLKDGQYTFVCCSNYKNNGSLCNRSLKLVVAADKKANWAYVKLNTENNIEKYNFENGTVGVGSYIYDNLISQESGKYHNKIIGGLVESVERKYYREEIMAILTKQASFHSELKDKQLYKESVEKLYPHNYSHQKVLLQQSISQLIADDILLYQRELKSKKSEIADCKFETYTYQIGDKQITKPVKAAHVANPYFQEFRIWKFINQMRIYENPNDEHVSLKDVTDLYYTNEVKASLFDEMQKVKCVKKTVLNKKFFKLPSCTSGYTWNYEEDHEEAGNETRYEFVRRLKRVKGLDVQKFLNATHNDNGKEVSNEYMLWHFFYSVKKASQREKGLPTLVARLLRYAELNNSLSESIISNLQTFTGYTNRYAAYSEKAMLKLLPLMRCGHHWNADDVAKITGVDNDEDFQGVMEYYACEEVYKDKLLELNSARWKEPNDIHKYLKHEFKSNSLKNPVVEKVIREMLFLVSDIWQQELQQNNDFKFDEIHVELGRELQKSPKQKLDYLKTAKENNLANYRAQLILKELKLESSSPFLREKYRIYEDCILSSLHYDKKGTLYKYEDENKNIQEISKEDILKIKESTEISNEDLRRYRLWLDQRFSSPYTGRPIKLSELFDRTKYQRDHVLPRERVSLDSLVNLVMCESVINKVKSALTGMEFINKYGGKKVGNYTIFTKKDYVEWVNTNIKNPNKKEILLSESVPSHFTNNQLGNTRYISRLALSLLSRIVREDNESTAISKHMIPVNGGVTSILRKNWDLDIAWNKLISPRFKRLNEEISKISGVEEDSFGSIRKIHGKKVFVPSIPEKYSDSIEKKRIDHRHHALDALVVALTQLGHIQYLNNVSGDKNSADAIKIRKALKASLTYSVQNEFKEKEIRFLPPAQYKQDGKIVIYKYKLDNEVNDDDNFCETVFNALGKTMVSFKQNMRIMSPRQNVYMHWNDETGRIMPSVESNLNENRKYCFRQKMSASDTIYGLRTKDGDKNLYLGTRWNHSLESLATDEKKCKEAIKCIADPVIRIILENYLESCENNPLKAFSPEGIKKMNASICDYTPNGKSHAPIYKVMMLQPSTKCHPISRNTEVKSRQYLKDNVNLSCHFYKDKIQVKSLEKYINGICDEGNDVFSVCKNDLVFIPSSKILKLYDKHKSLEQIRLSDIECNSINPDDVYCVSSFEPNGNTANFYCVPATMAKMIIEDNEGFKTFNIEDDKGKTKEVKIKGEIVLTNVKSQGPKTILNGEQEMIKEKCWKVILDRLGNVETIITRDGVKISRE